MRAARLIFPEVIDVVIQFVSCLDSQVLHSDVAVADMCRLQTLLKGS